MSKKRKHSKNLFRMRLTNVKGNFDKQMELFTEADKYAVLGDYQLAAGIWQHPQTQLWQVWMSTAGNDISWLTAYHDKVQAEQAVIAYKQFCATKDIYDADKCSDFFQQLKDASDAEPENASASEIANITKHIHEMVFDIHKQERGAF